MQLLASHGCAPLQTMLHFYQSKYILHSPVGHGFLRSSIYRLAMNKSSRITTIYCKISATDQTTMLPGGKSLDYESFDFGMDKHAHTKVAKLGHGFIT